MSSDFHIYRTLFETTSDAIVLLRQNRVMDCNPAGEQLFGKPRTELFGQNLESLLPEASASGLPGLLQQALSDHPIDLHWQVRTAHGTLLPVEGRLSRVTLDDDLLVLQLFAPHRNTVAPPANGVYPAATTGDTPVQYRMDWHTAPVLADSGYGVIFVVSDQDGVLQAISPSCAAVLGYTSNELESKTYLDYVHPDDVERVRATVLTLYEPNANVVSFEARFIAKDGGVRWLIWNLWLQTYEEIPLVYGVLVDQTTLRTVNEQIRLLEAAFDISTDGLTLVDMRLPDEPLVYINQGFAQMTGYARETVLGKNCRFLQGDDRDQEAIQEIRAAIRESRPAHVLLRNYRKDGSLFWNQLSLYPLLDTNGELTHYVGMQRDVTNTVETLERRGHEVELYVRVAEQMLATENLPELYRRTVDALAHEFEFYGTLLFVYNASTNDLTLAAAGGEVGEQLLREGMRIKPGDGCIGRAAAQQESLLITNTHPDWVADDRFPEILGELAVPITYRGQLLGVLDLRTRRPSRLDEELKLVLRGLSSQIAVAIESIRLREQMAEQLDELVALQRLMRREGWQTFQTRKDLATISYQYEQGSVLPAVQPASPMETEPVQQLIELSGEVIGTLTVYDDATARLNEDDYVLLAVVSEQVANALERARLLNETATRARELETVAQVSTVVSRVLDTQELLTLVANLTKERFNLYHAHIYLYDGPGELLFLAAGAGSIGSQMVSEGREIDYHSPRSIVALAARTGEPVIVNDVRSDPNFLPHPLLPETRAEVAIPMIVGDRLLGVLDVQSDRVGYFTEEDVRVKSVLASQVAVALQNAELYAEQAATVERLRELDTLKSSFLANMSHELRTPLNSILGFTDVLLEELDGPLTDLMRTDLQIVHKNGQHLLSLINDVLDMAKIEAGRMTLSFEVYDMAEVLSEVFDLASSLARERALKLVLDMHTDGAMMVEGDRTRMRQVMINLINNAIKFTDYGSVTVHTEQQDDKLLIQVIDTGLGIPPDKHDVIFEEFRQVDTSTTRKAGGTGLGLPITKHLIEMHGGRIWVESTGIDGEGSVFNVLLPIEQRPTAPTTDRPEEGAA